MRRKNESGRKEHITIWIEEENLDYLDAMIERGVFENRSQAIRHAIRTFVKMDKKFGQIIDSDSLNENLG